MPRKIMVEEHLKYPGFDQDSTFELRKTKDILKSATDEMSGNLYLQRLEDLESGSACCVRLEIDQAPLACATLHLC